MSQKLTRKQQRAAQRRKTTWMNVAWIAGAVLLIAAVIILSSSKSPSPSQPVGYAHIGSPMPDVALQDLEGNTVRISDFTGQPVLVNAWATWCPPCKAEMPDLQKYYQDHQSEGLVLLAINAGESASQVNQFIQQNGFTFPVLLDPAVQALNSLGIASFPTSILVGRDGVVKTIHVGMFLPGTLEEEITPLLAE